MGIGEWLTTPSRRRQGDKSMFHPVGRAAVAPIKKKVKEVKQSQALRVAKVVSGIPLGAAALRAYQTAKSESKCICGHRRAHPQCYAQFGLDA